MPRPSSCRGAPPRRSLLVLFLCLVAIFLSPVDGHQLAPLAAQPLARSEAGAFVEEPWRLHRQQQQQHPPLRPPPASADAPSASLVFADAAGEGRRHRLLRRQNEDGADEGADEVGLEDEQSPPPGEDEAAEKQKVLEAIAGTWRAAAEKLKRTGDIVKGLGASPGEEEEEGEALAATFASAFARDFATAFENAVIQDRSVQKMFAVEEEQSNAGSRATAVAACDASAALAEALAARAEELSRQDLKQLSSDTLQASKDQADEWAAQARRFFDGISESLGPSAKTASD